MAETIVTDLKLNLGPFEQQIEEAIAGMRQYATSEDEATKANKGFENSLGSVNGKLNMTKVAAEGAAKATTNFNTAQSNTAKSASQLSGLAGVWDKVKGGVSSAATSTVSFFKGARDGVKTAIGEVGGLKGVFSQLGTNIKGAVGSISNSFKGIGKVVGDAVPKVGGLGGSILGLLGPVGIATAAVAGIGAAFISNTDAGATFFDGVARTGGIVFDKLTGVFKRVSETISGLWDTLTDGETTIGKVFGGFLDIVLAIPKAIGRIYAAIGEVTGITDALAEAAAEGQALAQAYDAIDEAQYRNIKRNAELEKQVKTLEIQLRNRATSDEERLKIGEKLSQLESERLKNEVYILKQITAAKNREAENELKNKGEISDKTARALAEAEAAEIDAATRSLEITEQAQNRIDQIKQRGEAKRLAAAEKAAAAERKILEQRAAVEQELAKAQAASLGEVAKAEQEALDTRDARIAKAAGDAQLLIQIEQQYQADLQAIRDKAAADAEAIANKQAEALSAALLSSAQDRLERLKQEQEIELELAKANGEDVQALLTEQYNERASLEQDIRDQRLAALEAQYQEDYAALDGSLIAQYDRLAQFEVDKATLLNESTVNELDAKRQLLEQTQELSAAEEALAQTRIETVAGAGQIIGELAGESKAAAAIGFAAQKAAAIAQVIATTNAGIAAATAAAAAIPPVLPPGIPNPAFPLAQAVSAAQIARLKITAGLSLAQILAQSVSGFDKGGRITGNEGPRIRKAGGDNVLMTGKAGEIVLNERQQRELKRKTHPMIFGDIGVPGFAKPTTTFGFAQDPEIQYRWITGLEAVNSYAEGRSVTYNNTTTTAPVKFSDKGIKGAIGKGTKEARRQTELLALMAKANRRGNRRYYA